MIKIDKHSEPKAWIEYKNIPGVAFSGIQELKDALLDEQGFICAYCERRIPVKDTASNEDHRIEHWHCRSHYPQEVFNYDNLLACCPGQIDGSAPHCDVKKDNTTIEWSPLRQECVDTIAYQHDGTVFSTNDRWNLEINETLNLNHPLLKRNRRETLLGVIQSISKLKGQGKPWSIKNVRDQLKHWSSRHIDREGRVVFYPYCGIVIYYLKKKEETLQKQA